MTPAEELLCKRVDELYLKGKFINYNASDIIKEKSDQGVFLRYMVLVMEEYAAHKIIESNENNVF
jgi:hypothetical protein